jgi:hypothetical protein
MRGVLSKTAAPPLSGSAIDESLTHTEPRHPTAGGNA